LIERLPPDTVDHAHRLARAGAAALGVTPLSRAEVEAHFELGRGMPPPPQPRPFGGGFVSCELGAPGDEEAFARLLAVTDAHTPRQLAIDAQRWRIPVVDYRPPSFNCASLGRCRQPKDAQLNGRGLTVVDLTAMWAGPLATALLRTAGARVRKVEADVRLDGMRGTPSVYDALNAGKERLNLDLRDPHDRDAFFDAVRGADVVIDSFSRRVMPNLGLDHQALRAVNPHVITVSMPAFSGTSPERDWVSYGTGVHAASGLGDLGDGRVAASPISYPDPVAGFTAFAAVAERVAARRPGHLEVSLAAAIQPLVR
jgi:hypothetical protein